MFNEALELIYGEYQKSFNVVVEDEFLSGWAQEKMRHTMQVVGAGNYIIPRVKWLKQRSLLYVEMVKTAVLLHDVCRFSEIEHVYRKEKGYDHGVEGAKFLREIPQFSDIRIWLPIKHHGHLIEALYNDTEFQNIKSEELRKEVEQICFIVRDADKIANLHMFAYEPKMRHLFLGKEYNPQTDGNVSPIIKETAFNGTTTPRIAKSTATDKMVGYLSWYFDINYSYAVDFCNKLNVTFQLKRFLNDICHDNEFKQEFLKYFDEFLQTNKYLK